MYAPCRQPSIPSTRAIQSSSSSDLHFFKNCTYILLRGPWIRENVTPLESSFIKMTQSLHYSVNYCFSRNDFQCKATNTVQTNIPLIKKWVGLASIHPLKRILIIVDYGQYVHPPLLSLGALH